MGEGFERPDPYSLMHSRVVGPLTCDEIGQRCKVWERSQIRRSSEGRRPLHPSDTKRIVGREGY